MTKPCQEGYECPWGRKESETKVVCSMPRCVMTSREDRQFQFFERLMSSANTYERRGGRVRQKRHDTSG